jgi:5-methyltetrahydrofolate--homocysteine methyltransferase
VTGGDHPYDVTGDPDLLNLTRPDLILDIHRQYRRAATLFAPVRASVADGLGAGCGGWPMRAGARRGGR